MPEIQYTHEETAITYDEGRNVWTFTLRGRDRSAESLAKAKEFIDRPIPAEKAKPFEKISAWKSNYSDAPENVEVTGIAEGTRYGRGPQVWIKDSDGKRQKQSVLGILYASDEKNDAIAAEMISKRSEIDSLHSRIQELRAKLRPLEIASEEP